MADVSPIEISEQITTDAQTVVHDLSCVECNYNLRTLAHAAACPECGHPVVDSLHGDDLDYANSQWLRKIHIGLRLLATWLFAKFLLWQCFLVIRYLVIRITGTGDSLGTIIWISWEILTFLEAISLVAAALLLTISHPRKLSQHRPFWYWPTRIAAWLYLFTSLGFSVCAIQRMLIGGPMSDYPLMELASNNFELIKAIMPVVILLGCLIYLRRMAKQYHETRLARQTLFLIIVCSSVIWFSVPIGLLIGILILLRVGSWFQSYGWVPNIFYLCLLCLTFAYLNMVKQARAPATALYNDSQAAYSAGVLGAGYGARFRLAIRCLKWALILFFTYEVYSEFNTLQLNFYCFLNSPGDWFILVAGALMFVGVLLLFFKPCDYIRKYSNLHIPFIVIVLTGCIGLGLTWVELSEFIEAEKNVERKIYDIVEFSLSWPVVILFAITLFTLHFHLIWITRKIGQRKIAFQFIVLFLLWLAYAFWNVPCANINHSIILQYDSGWLHQDWFYYERFLMVVCWALSLCTILLLDQLWRQLDRARTIKAARDTNSVN